jgi:glycosyltransferase involved in cell wall biosynthesis
MKYVVNCRFSTQATTGVQRYAFECSKIIKVLFDNNVVFVAPKGEINQEIKDELGIKQCGVFRGHLWEQISLPIFVKSKKSTLISFCGMPPIFYKNTIYTIHDLAFLKYPDFFNYYYQFFYNFFIKIAYKRCIGILTVSNTIKRELIDSYGLREIFVVYNSISHLKEKVDSNDLDFVRSGDYILAVGSMDPRKNLEKLISIFIKENPDYKLVIVGKKNSVFSDNKLSSLKSDKVIFTGYLNDTDLLSCYANAKCFIYPSMYEGFGIPPLEAIYCNTPVAVSDIDTHREILGNYVYYFPLEKFIDIDSIIDKSKKIHKKENEKYTNTHPLLEKFSGINQSKQMKKALSIILNDTNTF